MPLNESIPTRVADGLDEAHRAIIAERTTEAIDNNLSPETARVTRRVARGLGAISMTALGSYLAYRTGANVKEAWDATFDSGIDVGDGAGALIPDKGETALTMLLAGTTAGFKAVGTERRPSDDAWSDRDGVVQRSIARKRKVTKWALKKKQNTGTKLTSRVAGKQAKSGVELSVSTSASDTHMEHARASFGVPGGRRNYKRVSSSINKGRRAGKGAAKAAGKNASANYNMGRRTRIEQDNQDRVDEAL